MALLIFLLSVPGTDRLQLPSQIIPTTSIPVEHRAKPQQSKCKPHTSAPSARACALRGLRTGSNPLKSQSKRLLGNETGSKPQRDKGKAEMRPLSTGGANLWMAYPIANQSSRGKAIYMLHIANVCRNGAGGFGRKFTCVTAFIFN